jgi:sugar phosphate isomerase/epimerase
MRIAFSTVACPDWTLERVMSFADDAEYDGVELRTFGWGGTGLACDPALTDGAKVRRLAIESGTQVMCLGTSLKFDDAIRPPVLGRVLASEERSLEAGKRFLQLADDLECPSVRVFGFEAPGGEKRAVTHDRVVRRLRLLLDAARARRVRIVLENGGTFSRAEDLAEIITACAHPWLGAAYNIAVGAGAGDQPERAIDLLGDRLWTVKLKDLRGPKPVEIGQGEVPLRRVVEHLARSGYGGWIVVEWMKYWVPELAEGEGVLRRAVGTLQEWIAGAGAGQARRAARSA